MVGARANQYEKLPALVGSRHRPSSIEQRKEFTMTVRIQTTEAASFTATADWTDQPTFSCAWIRVGGTDYFLGEDDFTAPELLENGDSYNIPSGTMYDLTFTPDGGAAGEADQALARLMNAGADEVTLRFSLHDGEPGTDHTGNEIAVGNNAGYSRASAQFEVVVP